jgi:hypothetical protein
VQQSIVWQLLQKNGYLHIKKKATMQKTIQSFLLATAFICLLNSCSLFRRSEKLGCGTDGRNVGAEKLAASDEKALKASSKAKYKGGRKSY